MPNVLRRRFLSVLMGIALLGLTPPTNGQALDSDLVVQRSMAALHKLQQPRNVVFSYTVSQAGAHNLEQTHRIFRSLNRQRDETLSIDGDPIRTTRVLKRIDRYAIAKVAPRLDGYVFLLLATHRNGKHLDYVYSTSPRGPRAFVITEVTIDGITYLPSLVRFKVVNGTIKATGWIAYARFSKYWLPTLATATATIVQKPTRERIAWSAYSFPAALPPSTFLQPKPLAIPTLAPL